MSNEVNDLPLLYVVYNIKTNKFWNYGHTYSTVGAAKNSWNAHTFKRDLYPEHKDPYSWKHAVWSEDAHNNGFVVVKVKLVVVDET